MLRKAPGFRTTTRVIRDTQHRRGHLLPALKRVFRPEPPARANVTFVTPLFGFKRSIFVNIAVDDGFLVMARRLLTLVQLNPYATETVLNN